MKKTVLKLSDLKIQSFVTCEESSINKTIKGGKSANLCLHTHDGGALCSSICTILKE